MIGSSDYNKRIRIHNLMGVMIISTIIYLLLGFSMVFSFCYFKSNFYLFLLLFVSIIYFLSYTTVAIIFRKLVASLNNRKLS